MKEIYRKITELDRVVNEPARLAILIALYELKEADFVFLHRITGITRGNLSAHLKKLEEAGYVEIEKKFVGKKPMTIIRLTREGRRALTRYFETLKDAIQNIESDGDH